MARTLYAEPRTTVEIDVVVSFEGSTPLDVVDRLLRRFSVPRQAALDAIATGGSFNLLDTESGFKVDLFAASGGVLDTNQLARRRALELSSVCTRSGSPLRRM